jgi:hypothetical protein
MFKYQLMRIKHSFILFSIMFLFFEEKLFAQSIDGQRENLAQNWHVSIGTGQGWVSSEVKSTVPNTIWNFAVRRNLSNWFSVQIQYAGGIYKGMNHFPSSNYGNNPAWANKYNAPLNVQATFPNPPGSFIIINSADRVQVPPGSLDPVYYNYRSALHQLTFSARIQGDISSLLNVYGSLGIGAFTYNTKVDALDNSNRPYKALFKTVNDRYATRNATRSEILRELRAGLDRVYETPAEAPKQNIHYMPLQVTTGFAFRLSPSLELGLEYQFSFTREQLIDGQSWKEDPLGDAALSQKFDKLHGLGMSLILGF